MNAMVTLMNVIHGHGHKVPRTLSIEELVRFTILMDYFLCAEICSPYTEIWTERIMHGSEKHNLSIKDNLKALWVFQLLQHEKGFEFFKLQSIRTMNERPYRLFLLGTENLLSKIFHNQTRAQEKTNEMLRGNRFQESEDHASPCVQDGKCCEKNWPL
jgi:hypothetical protein